VPLDRVRLTAAKFGLGRHRKLRLARPRAWTRAQPQKTMNTASPDPRARTWAWPRKTTNSASPDPGLGLGLGPRRGRTPPRLTQGLDSVAAPKDDGLHLARPGARTRPRPRKMTVSASLDPGLGLDLDHGRQTRPRPRRSFRLARPRARTNHVTGGAIITLPLASSGYGEQDRRPIWLAPVNK
jgi:hypothetical protein